MLSNPAFLLIQFLNSLALGMNLFVIASGLTLIFGVLRVANFAHGAFFMIGAYVCYAVVSQLTSTPGAFWIGVIVRVVITASAQGIAVNHYIYVIVIPKIILKYFDVVIS